MKESYQTRQGALILQTMQNLAGPVTAEALCAILREQRVSKATVYRHLERLTASGQVRRFFPAEGAAACYQYVGDHHDCHLHPHMVCVPLGLQPTGGTLGTHPGAPRLFAGL